MIADQQAARLARELEDLQASSRESNNKSQQLARTQRELQATASKCELELALLPCIFSDLLLSILQGSWQEGRGNWPAEAGFGRHASHVCP